jgi:hypothetical protein
VVKGVFPGCFGAGRGQYDHTQLYSRSRPRNTGRQPPRSTSHGFPPSLLASKSQKGCLRIRHIVEALLSVSVRSSRHEFRLKTGQSLTLWILCGLADSSDADTESTADNTQRFSKGFEMAICRQILLPRLLIRSRRTGTFTACPKHNKLA